METSCISHPPQQALIVLRKWQVDFCNGNHCAAMLLANFEYWHNIKCDMLKLNRHDESPLFHKKLEEIKENLLGMYSDNTINKGIKLLESLGVISIHKNPDPRYSFDRTRYFKFYPNICQAWIDGRYQQVTNQVTQNKSSDECDQPLNNSTEENSVTAKSILDDAKMRIRERKIKQPSIKFKSSSRNFEPRSLSFESPSGKSACTITEITSEITPEITSEISNVLSEPVDKSDAKQYTLTHPLNFLSDAKIHVKLQDIVQYMQDVGIPSAWCNTKPDHERIVSLVKRGADLSGFQEAYRRAEKAKGQGSIGARYLCAIVQNGLEETNYAPLSKWTWPNNKLEDFLEEDAYLEKLRTGTVV